MLHDERCLIRRMHGTQTAMDDHSIDSVHHLLITNNVHEAENATFDEYLFQQILERSFPQGAVRVRLFRPSARLQPAVRLVKHAALETS